MNPWHWGIMFWIWSLNRALNVQINFIFTFCTSYLLAVGIVTARTNSCHLWCHITDNLLPASSACLILMISHYGHKAMVDLQFIPCKNLECMLSFCIAHFGWTRSVRTSYLWFEVDVHVSQAGKTLFVPTPRHRPGLLTKLTLPENCDDETLNKCATRQVLNAPSYSVLLNIYCWVLKYACSQSVKLGMA